MRLLLLLSLSLLCCGCDSQTKPQLHLFVWSEYFSPQAIKQFEDEYACHVVLDTFDSNEAMYTKLRLGTKGYDIVMPSNYIYETMQEQGMLRPINLDNLPNLVHLNREELDSFGIDNLSTGIPYLMTYSGLGYIQNRVSNFEPSWTIFARKDLRGRMTMLNDMREALGAALLTLGYSVNTNSVDELNQAVDLLLKWRENLAKFESEQYKNGLANLEFLVVQGYNSDILQVMTENPQATFGWTYEGTIASIDLLAILKNAPNPELAENFINFCLRPEVAAQIVKTSYTTCLVKIPSANLPQDPEILSILQPSTENRKKAQLIRNVGDSLQIYTDAWERVLTGG